MEEELIKSIPDAFFKPAALILFMAGLFLVGIVIYLLKELIAYIKADSNKKNDRLDDHDKAIHNMAIIATAHEERFKAHDGRIEGLEDEMKEDRVVRYKRK